MIEIKKVKFKYSVAYDGEPYGEHIYIRANFDGREVILNIVDYGDDGNFYFYGWYKDTEMDLSKYKKLQILQICKYRIKKIIIIELDRRYYRNLIKSAKRYFKKFKKIKESD